MKKLIKNLMILTTLALSLMLISCELTTSIPNIITGRWVNTVDGITMHLFNIKPDGTYNHTKYNESEMNTVVFEGKYSVKYNSFEIVSATGTLEIDGKQSTPYDIENETYRFSFSADSYNGPLNLKLVGTKGDVIELTYIPGGAV